MSCPICEKATLQDYRPFCSKRCADVDLAKWMNESYALASNDPDDSDTLIDAMQQALIDPESKQDEKLH